MGSPVPRPPASFPGVHLYIPALPRPHTSTRPHRQVQIPTPPAQHYPHIFQTHSTPTTPVTQPRTVTNDDIDSPCRAAPLPSDVLWKGCPRAPLFTDMLVVVAGPGPSHLRPAVPAQLYPVTAGTHRRTMSGGCLRSPRLAGQLSARVLDEDSTCPTSEVSTTLTWPGPSPVVHPSKGYPRPAAAQPQVY